MDNVYDDTVKESVYADATGMDGEGMYADTEDTRIEMDAAPATATVSGPRPMPPAARMSKEKGPTTSKAVVIALGVVSTVSVALVVLVIYLLVTLLNVQKEVRIMKDTINTDTWSGASSSGDAYASNATLFALADRVTAIEDTWVETALVDRMGTVEVSVQEEENRTTQVVDDFEAFKSLTLTQVGAIWSSINGDISNRLLVAETNIAAVNDTATGAVTFERFSVLEQNYISHLASYMDLTNNPDGFVATTEDRLTDIEDQLDDLIV
jgi:hypothetical protein